MPIKPAASCKVLRRIMYAGRGNRYRFVYCRDGARRNNWAKNGHWEVFCVRNRFGPLTERFCFFLGETLYLFCWFSSWRCLSNSAFLKDTAPAIEKEGEEARFPRFLRAGLSLSPPPFLLCSVGRSTFIFSLRDRACFLLTFCIRVVSVRSQRFPSPLPLIQPWTFTSVEFSLFES